MLQEGKVQVERKSSQVNWGCSLHVTWYQGDGASRGRTARSRRRGRFSISHMM